VVKRSSPRTTVTSTVGLEPGSGMTSPSDSWHCCWTSSSSGRRCGGRGACPTRRRVRACSSTRSCPWWTG